MLQKRKAVKPHRGSNTAKKLRKPISFDSWFDATIRLKEHHSFDEFESMMMEKCNNKKVAVDDRAMCAYELALLYCQQGLFARADHLLHELGFKYRIGKDLWCHEGAARHRSTISDGKLACYDDVLPQCFLSRLLDAFSPESPFWSDHEYPTDSFFSYNTNIQSNKSSRKKNLKSNSSKKSTSEYSRDGGENLIAQLAIFLKPLVRTSFPDKNIEDIRSVEWWAHTRPNGPAAGHRFHYDLDEARLRSVEGAEAVADFSIHPCVSSVIYLDDGGSSGAPTVVIDQDLQGPRSDRAWMCVPKTSRLLLFDGKMLHGVVPHINSASSSGTRLTLMIGWWGSEVHTTDATSPLGPNMRMPNCTDSDGDRWPSLFRPLSNHDISALRATSKNPELSHDAVISITKRVWEPVKDTASAKLPSLEIGDNNVLFVGNWFLQSKNELNEEILKSAEMHREGYSVAQSEPVVASSEVGWLSMEDLKKLRG